MYINREYVLSNPFLQISLKGYKYTTPFGHEIINLDQNEKRVSYSIP